jgi:hypothetical protein
MRAPQPFPDRRSLGRAASVRRRAIERRPAPAFTARHEPCADFACRRSEHVARGPRFTTDEDRHLRVTALLSGARVGVRRCRLPPSAAARNRIGYSRRGGYPIAAGKVRKQRIWRPWVWHERNQPLCRHFLVLEGSGRSPENRGVPGSSPGLSIGQDLGAPSTAEDHTPTCRVAAATSSG